MSVEFDLPRLKELLGSDPEFRLHSRYMNATLRVVVGATQQFSVHFVDGTLTMIDPQVTVFDSYDILLKGTEEHWANLLAPVPAAFYQDFFPAALCHGFQIEGNVETIMAYYPALRRLGDLFREIANSAVNA